jgi:hypothetical protein
VTAGGIGVEPLDGCEVGHDLGTGRLPPRAAGTSPRRGRRGDLPWRVGRPDHGRRERRLGCIPVSATEQAARLRGIHRLRAGGAQPHDSCTLQVLPREVVVLGRRDVQAVADELDVIEDDRPLAADIPGNVMASPSLKVRDLPLTSTVSVELFALLTPSTLTCWK